MALILNSFNFKYRTFKIRFHTSPLRMHANELKTHMSFPSLYLRPKSFSYQIQEKLGEGLNATVYKARREYSSRGPSQIVALKILKSKTSIERWRQEFHTLSSISSPYCVSLLGWEILDNSKLALVLEWVNGISLKEFFFYEDSNKNEVLNLCSQIHEGLKTLKKKKSFHGDLSPSNILIEKSGQVKLIDFGLSFYKNKKAPFFQTTIDFSAPEILKNKMLPNYDSDLYSLGALMRFLCSKNSSSHLSKDPSFLNPLLHLEAEKRRVFFLQEKRGIPHLSFNKKIQRIMERKRLLSNKNFQTQSLKDFPKKRLSPSFLRLLSKKKISNQKRLLKKKYIPLCFSLLFLFQLKGETDFKKPIPHYPPHSSHNSYAPHLTHLKEQPTNENPKLNHKSNSIDKMQVLNKKAQIIVSTHFWTKIKINGEEKGYAPLVLKDISPGLLLIEAKTHKGSILKRLKVKANEKVVLSDSFFNL